MPPVVDKLKSLTQRLTRREAPLPFPDTLNIESSYQCNLKCVMCPRHFDEALQGMFDIELFKNRVVPVLPRFKYVHLTGWGEPLMNKHLVEMLALAKQAGAWTCFTTNGLLLKEPLSRRVLETGLELISISCDAAEPRTYEMVRGRGTFDVLQERMRHMVALRREMQAPTRLHWVFVMMKNNLHEVVAAARKAAENGLDRFEAKHMETGYDRKDLANALWNNRVGGTVAPEWEEKLATALEELQEVGRQTGIEIFIHPRQYARDGQCLARPAHNVFIDYRGNVSSCCYLNKLDVKPYILPEQRPTDDGVMGSITLTELVEVLDSPRYVEFRRQWLRGEVPPSCFHCVNLDRMEAGA
jgi:MoaA/NifB/PqqE/SkfB family radical SAM enzyme